MRKLNKLCLGCKERCQQDYGVRVLICPKTTENGMTKKEILKAQGLITLSEQKTKKREALNENNRRGT